MINFSLKMQKLFNYFIFVTIILRPYLIFSQKDIKIDTVTVKPDYETRIILEALENIKYNYPDFSMTFECYFNETIFDNKDTIQDYEAIIELYKTSYTSRKSDRIKFTQANIKTLKKKHELWDYMFFVNGPYETVLCDVAKRPKYFIVIPVLKTNFLLKRHFKLFKYNLNHTDSTYIISFRPNDNYRRAVFEGKIIIDRENFAIKSLEYQYSKDRMERVNSFPSCVEIALEKEGMRIPEKSFYHQINYKKFKNKYVIDRVFNKYSFLFDSGFDDDERIITVKNSLKVVSKTNKCVKKISFFKQVPKNMETIKLLPKTNNDFWIKYHQK